MDKQNLESSLPEVEVPAGKHASMEGISNEPNKGRGNRRGPWRVIFWISIVILAAAIGVLAYFITGYMEGCKMYDDIADEALDSGEGNLADMKVDWDALRAINPEVCGWVYVPGTKINYPIVHTSNNEKYLTTTFHGYSSRVSFGTIFLDCNNKPDFSDACNFTYGHHMNDGSMYAFFDSYRDSEVLNNNRFIYVLTPQGNYKTSAFACVVTSGTDKIVQTNFANDQSRVDYINDKISRSVSHLYGNTPSAIDMTKIFAFSTCDYTQSDGRCIVFSYVYESTVDGVPGLYN